ncbi:hypothetical protein OAG68_00990 [bacterium]|nr:hypothetical protein [bacterium]
MGWFDWLFVAKDPNRQELEGLVFLSESGKFNWLEKAIGEGLKPMVPGRPVSAIVLVGHFEKTVEKLHAIVEQADSVIPVEALLASDLPKMFRGGSEFDDSRSIEVLVAEKHPSLSKDDQMKDLIASMPFPTRIRFVVSLDDGLMRAFAGESVRRILEMGGFDDEHPIESRMVDKRIRSAQRRNDQMATSSLNADSAEEWMTKNGLARLLIDKE